MAKQPYQVHVTSSDMKKLLETQVEQLEHVKSISQLLSEAKEGKRVADANPSGKVGKGDLKLDNDEIVLRKEKLELDKKILKTEKEISDQREAEAKAIANLAKSVTALKTPSERLAEFGKKMKSALDPLNMLSKVNIGGIFSRTINKEKFIRAQRAAGATGDRSELSDKFEKAEKTSKALKANEARFEENRKAAGLSESEYSKTVEGARLRKERSGLAEEHAQHDVRANLVRRDMRDDNEPAVKITKAPMTKVTSGDLSSETVPTLKSPTAQFADAGKSEEDQIEAAKATDKQNELLQKIEVNTRGASPDQKAKPKEEGGGGGLLGSLLGGGKGAAMLKGLKDFGVGLVLVAGSLWVAAKAFQEFSEVEWGGVMKGMVALGVMVAAAVGLSKASRSLKEVGVGLIAMSGALFITAKALQEFADVKWGDIGKGIIALGGLVIAAIALDKVKGQLFGGALAIGAMSIALWGAAKAFEEFGNVKWSDMGKAALAIGGLAAAAMLLQPAIPFMFTAGAALGVLGAGLWVVGKAMQAVGEGFDKMTSGIEKLGQIDGENLFKVAGGLLAVSGAMVAFGGAQALAGLGALVGKLLSFGQDSPMEQLEKISKYGEGIGKAGDGMKGLGEGMKAFSEIKGDTLKDTMKALKEFPWEQATKFVGAGGAMQVSSAKVYNASKTNADEQAKSEGSKGGGNTTVVNAPVNNNTTQNQMIKSPIRNQESTQQRYLGGRFATF